MARKATASKNLPTSGDVPKGMKKIGSGFAPTWKPEKPGDSIHGKVTDAVKTVEFENKRKVKGKMVTEKTERRVMEVTAQADGKRYAVWESAALVELFDNVVESGVGTEVFIQYDGLGKKKPGQNPPKLFTVGIAA